MYILMLRCLSDTFNHTYINTTHGPTPTKQCSLLNFIKLGSLIVDEFLFCNVDIVD